MIPEQHPDFKVSNDEFAEFVQTLSRFSALRYHLSIDRHDFISRVNGFLDSRCMVADIIDEYVAEYAGEVVNQAVFTYAIDELYSYVPGTYDLPAGEGVSTTLCGRQWYETGRWVVRDRGGKTRDRNVYSIVEAQILLDFGWMKQFYFRN